MEVVKPALSHAQLVASMLIQDYQGRRYILALPRTKTYVINYNIEFNGVDNSEI